MKKLLLTSLSIVAILGTTVAQTYFQEDFGTATGNPIANWTDTDNDGDGNTWNAADVTSNINTTGSSAISNSWISSGPLTPDNLLTTTTAINLSSATSAVTLFWAAGNVETSNNWWEEYYDVIITTSNSVSVITSATPVFSETLPSGGTMLNRQVNLAAYAGQTVYLTFRHHNCTDENFLIIDDVEIREVVPNDAEMTALTFNSYAAAGNMTVTGTVKNLGSSPITAMDIIWDDGTGPYTASYSSLNIVSGGTYNFTHSTPLNVVGGTNYNLNVSVALTGDANSSNDTLTKEVAGLTSIPAKMVVGEEKTGTWCGWCPRGAVGLSSMQATTTFIGIGVHNNDPMAITAYDQGTATYHPGFTGYPHGAVDRVIGGDPNASSFNSMHSQRVNAIVPCDVKNIVATLNTSTNQITVSADAEFYGNIPGNYRLSCVIIEDDVMGTGGTWNQTNYYSGGGNGNLTDPVTGFQWHTAGDPVAPSLFGGYDHTARSLSNNDILGNSGSLPSGTVPIGVYSYTFSNVSGSILDDASKAHAVVMVVDASNGQILNAQISPISIVSSVDDVASREFGMVVFPNPTANIATISFKLEESTQVTMNVMNSLGSLIHTSTQHLDLGVQKLTFDGTELPNGVYFVNLTIGNKVITKKISLLK